MNYVQDIYATAHNDFFDPIKESKWWEPEKYSWYYDFYGDKVFNDTEWDDIDISA
jgi:hypothetical protein